LANLADLLIAQAIEKRQRQRPIRHLLSDSQIFARIHVRGVKRLQMLRGEITSAADSPRRQVIANKISIRPREPRCQTNHEDEPAQSSTRDVQGRNDHFGDRLKLARIPHRDSLARFQNLAEPLHLRDAQRAVDFRKTIVVPQQAMLQPAVARPSPLITERPHSLRKMRIPSYDHSTFAGRDRLVGIEPKHSEIADSPHASPAILRPNGLTRVLDHRHPVFPRDFHDRIEIRGMPERVHDNDRARPRRNLLLDPSEVQGQTNALDVDEHWLRTLVQHRVTRSDESERRQDHFIAFADS